MSRKGEKMDKPIFSRLIKCKHCNGNFKAKKERGTRKYVCSKYDNSGQCERHIIREDFLVDLIERRFQRKLSRGEIREEVSYIEVETRYKFKIFLKNESSPIIVSENFIQY